MLVNYLSKTFLLPVGKKKNYLHIPHQINNNKKLLERYLRGLFDTDGYVQKRRAPGFSNISEEMIKQIQKLLLRFGIISRIRRRNKSSGKGDSNGERSLHKGRCDKRRT